MNNSHQDSTTGETMSKSVSDRTGPVPVVRLGEVTITITVWDRTKIDALLFKIEKDARVLRIHELGPRW